MAASPDYPPPSQSSSLSFTQGFLLGQLSIALLIVFFIKFFIFGELPSADSRAASYAAARRQRTLQHQQQQQQQSQRTYPSPSKRPRSASASASPAHTRNLARKPSSHILRNPPPLTTASILRKTYYDASGHQPESLDWFNVLIAQTIAGLREDAAQDDAILTSLSSILNGDRKPDWLGEIRVTEISLGEEFPIFSNCRIIPVEEGFLGSGAGMGEKEGEAGGGGGGRETRLQARMDVDLSDVITLGVETSLVLNYPRPVVAVLPVALAVSVVRFSGTLSLSFIPSPPPSSSSSSTTPNPAPPTSLAFTFLDDYRLDLSVRSLLGSRSRLQDIPKIAELVEARLHAWFDDRCVEPRFQQIVLPSLWPRKQNTRGGEEEVGPAAGVASENGTAPADARTVELGSEERRQREEGVDAADGGPVPASGTPGTRPSRPHTPSNDDGSLESRLAREGAKLRQAEERADERPPRRFPTERQAERAQRVASVEREGLLNRRGTERGALGPGLDLHRRPGLGSRESSWGPARRMPGSLPA